MNTDNSFPTTRRFHQGFPFHPTWSAQQLADAVPLRLFELFEFEVEPGHAADNQPRIAPRAARDWRGGYLRPAPLPVRFRVHN